MFFIAGLGHSFSYAKSDLVDYESIDAQIAEDVKKYHIPGMAIMVVDKDGVLFSNTYGNWNYSSLHTDLCANKDSIISPRVLKSAESISRSSSLRHSAS